jgi:hypothetical protein
MTAAERQRRRRERLKRHVDATGSPLEIYLSAHECNRVPELWAHCASAATRALDVMRHAVMDERTAKQIRSIRYAIDKIAAEHQPQPW